jgi:predicted TIM-barrel fold metal-dependent hydrolase
MATTDVETQDVEVAGGFFDADNHYYEPLDAFTRHLPAGAGPRTVEIADIGGRLTYVVGGRVFRVVSNPTFDPIVKPGCLYEYFRGNPDRKQIADYFADSEPLPAGYRQPAARLEMMDAQGLAAVWLFPTIGVLVEEQLKDDPSSVVTAFGAFNRWLLEDWGFNHEDRIFGAPYISLADPEAARSELQWALDNGARVVCMRPAAPTTTFGQKSPADPYFDRFWSLANDAGITVAIHAGSVGYTANGYAPKEDFSAFGADVQPGIWRLIRHRPILDCLAALTIDGLFERFPNLRIASIENGSEYLPVLLHELRGLANARPQHFKEDPIETFRRHVWVSPFWEDDISETVENMGVDRIIFGSDWPHAEGLRAPLDELQELAGSGIPAEEQALIMGANTWGLNTLSPT